MVVKNRKGLIQYHAKGIDHQVQEIINGPDGMLSREKGWRLSALLPGSMNQGIAVLERQAKRVLPDPKPIVKPEEEKLEKTTDEELARMQERAAEWTGEENNPEGLTEEEQAGVWEVADTPEEADGGQTEGGQ